MSTTGAKDFVIAGAKHGGWSTEDEATATCYCSQVQLKFVSNSLVTIPHSAICIVLTLDRSKPLSEPGLEGSLICHCADCHKISASVFLCLFTIKDSHLTHVRGQDHLKSYTSSKGIQSGKSMTSFFCNNCGTLMYRTSESYPGSKWLPLGTVDDLRLRETALKPTLEQFVKDRADWLHAVPGVAQVEGMIG